MSTSRNARKDLKILIVEDDAVNMMALRKMLAGIHSTRYYTETVFTLEQAFGLLGVKNFDAVILDLNLPDSKGVHTVFRITKQFHSIPIVVTTGTRDEGLVNKAKALGAQECLFKGRFDGYCLNNAIHYAVENKNLKDRLAKIRHELAEIRLSLNLPAQSF